MNFAISNLTLLLTFRFRYAILEAINREQGSPEERRIAVVRAGAIAQAYQGDSLVDRLFAFTGAVLHENNDLNL